MSLAQASKYQECQYHPSLNITDNQKVDTKMINDALLKKIYLKYVFTVTFESSFSSSAVVFDPFVLRLLFFVQYPDKKNTQVDKKIWKVTKNLVVDKNIGRGKNGW
jgi:hypothetical protein